MPLNEFVFPADRIENVQTQVCVPISTKKDGFAHVDTYSWKICWRRIITCIDQRRRDTGHICSHMRRIH